MQTVTLHNPVEDQLTESQQWLALDDVAEWSTFSQSHEKTPEIWESNVSIDGMHCAACAINVENTLTALKGVETAHVNAASGRAKLVWDAEKIKPSDWMQAISQAGYQPSPATEFFALNARKKEQRKMLWRLLVAAFCMIQVMMYSAPAYYAAPGEISDDTLGLMRWASWVLTLPVLFFACGPFYQSAWIDLKKGQVSMDLPVALGITITFLMSTAVTFEPGAWWGTEVYFDSLTMLVFFLLSGRWLMLRMHNQTAGALDVLMRRLPGMVEKLNTAGEYQAVPARQLKVHDQVRVLPGAAFPADGVLMTGDTEVDESLLTGESRPVHKTTGDTVIAGSHNLNAAVEMQIDKLGQATQYAQIVALMERAAVDKPRLALLADRIAKPFLIAVLLAASLTALYLWQADPSRAMMTAVAILIVTCPCALSLATPAAMLTASGALANAGVMVRKMQALEALSAVDTVVFDKTGTLTIDQMQIGHISTVEHLTETQAISFAYAMAQTSLHPVSRAIVTMANARDVKPHAQIKNVEEVAGGGLRMTTEMGDLRLGNAAFCDLTDSSHTSQSAVYLVSDLGWLATFEILESIKPEAAETVQQLKDLGLNVLMASGDQASSVQRVAAQLRIQQAEAACSPQEKLQYIQSLQNKGQRILMVGDGLNDGPVLAAADASIAMGQAVPLAQAKSDFVVLGGQLQKVAGLIQQAKRTMKIVKQNLSWAALYNAICVPLAIMGLLPAWLAGLGMALSSVLVILNARRLSHLKTEEV